MAVRSDYLVSFEQVLAPVILLDRFKIAGVIAHWWNHAYDELKTIVAQGFTGLIDGWITTIRDAVAGDDDQDDDFKPLEHKIVARLIPEYLQELAEVEAEIARLKQEKEAFERGEHLDSEDTDGEEDGERNYIRELEDQRKKLRAEVSDAQARIKYLSRGPNVKDQGSIAAQEKLGNDMTALRAELASLEQQVRPVLAEIEAIDRLLEPYDEIETRLTEARRRHRQLVARLLDRLDEAHQKLTPEEDRRLVRDMIRDDIAEQLKRYVAEHRQQVIVTIENWWDKYHVPMNIIEDERGEMAERLRDLVEKLRYV